jgi:hypothetical protein
MEKSFLSFSAPADVQAGLQVHAMRGCMRRDRNGTPHPALPSCTNRCSTASCLEPCIGIADDCTASPSLLDSWVHLVVGKTGRFGPNARAGIASRPC